METRLHRLAVYAGLLGFCVAVWAGVIAAIVGVVR